MDQSRGRNNLSMPQMSPIAAHMLLSLPHFVSPDHSLGCRHVAAMAQAAQAARRARCART